ncbi:hypothetical protein FM109_04775 [Vibrio casei]|nr:hypothetical protein FM109_04775 [Vibrio casei]
MFFDKSDIDFSINVPISATVNFYGICYSFFKGEFIGTDINIFSISKSV